VLGAPLTAIVFAFGLTHDSEALLPLLLTTAVAYGFSVLTMKRSIMTEKIARRGLHIYREYGVDPLERAHVGELMTRDVVSIDASLPVTEALPRYFGDHAAHRAYPVLRDGRVIGMLQRAAIVAACRRRCRTDLWRSACRCRKSERRSGRAVARTDRSRRRRTHGRTQRGQAASGRGRDHAAAGGHCVAARPMAPSSHVLHGNPA
jgi:hypothetical protein